MIRHARRRVPDPRVRSPRRRGCPTPPTTTRPPTTTSLTGREADGPEPAQLPGDRTPVAVDRFGTTAEEQLDGESLDYKLQRESYERPADDPLAGPVDPDIAAEADNEEAAAQAQLDADVIDPGPTSDPNSPVSLYDHGQLGTVADATGGPAGASRTRGRTPTRRPTTSRTTPGAAGGGATAEELAIHETRTAAFGLSGLSRPGPARWRSGSARPGCAAAACPACSARGSAQCGGTGRAAAAICL